MTKNNPKAGVADPVLRWIAAFAVVGVCFSFLYWYGGLVGFGSFWFAFNLHILAMGAAHLLHRIFEPALTSRYFEVLPWEPQMYRWFGVVGFMHLLRRIGWTAATRNSLVFDGTRKSLHTYERATRESEHAHLWIFVLIGTMVAYALVRGWWGAAWWLGSMNVFFQLYPVMLQRTQRPRLQKMLARKCARS